MAAEDKSERLRPWSGLRGNKRRWYAALVPMESCQEVTQIFTAKVAELVLRLCSLGAAGLQWELAVAAAKYRGLCFERETYNSGNADVQDKMQGGRAHLLLWRRFGNVRRWLQLGAVIRSQALWCMCKLCGHGGCLGN